jgi:hypothetical protein
MPPDAPACVRILAECCLRDIIRSCQEAQPSVGSAHV